MAQLTSGYCNQLGKQYQYSFKMDGISFSDIGKLYSNDSINKKTSFFQSASLRYMQLTFECSIIKTTIYCDQNTRIDAFQVIDPVLKDSGSAFQSDFQTIQQEIGKSFFVNSSPFGKVLSIQADSALSYSSLNIVKDIVSRLQFIITPGKNVWNTNEENTVGSFVARYAAIDSQDGAIKYKKTNMGFKNSSTFRKNQQYFPESYSVYEFDESSQLKQLTSSEALLTTIKKDTVSIYAARVNLKMMSIEQVNESLLMKLNQLKNSHTYQKKSGISSSLTQEEINKMAFTNTLGNENFESLSRYLKSANQFSASESEQLRLKFRALAYIYPHTCQQISSLLEKMPYPSNAFTILTEALGHTGTTYSNEAIAVVIRTRKLEAPVVTTLLPFLLDNPSTDTSIEIIKSIAFNTQPEPEVNSSAQLVLAGMAGNLATTDPAAARRLVLYIIDNFKKVSDPLQRIYMMANTKSPLVLKNLEYMAWDKSIPSKYRIATVEAIGNIQSEQTCKILKKLSASSNEQLADTASKILTLKQRVL